MRIHCPALLLTSCLPSRQQQPRTPNIAASCLLLAALGLQ
uniref:Uncharacterized protein n=1 Tax=Arundo donax TaxID=35708 RepID=A0A0A8XZG7_ARUDO